MAMRMRIGIVGGQKRKTEAHLFKSLEEIGIDVAWHVEAMTNREFGEDCDAIVSMVDYIGHGLEAKAKEFSRLKGIPFRRITFNWSKAKPTFVELQDKFNAIHNTEDTMKKIIPPNTDWANAEDIAFIVGCTGKTVRNAGDSGKIKRYSHKTGDNREFSFYSIAECKEYFKTKQSTPSQEFVEEPKEERTNFTLNQNQMVVCSVGNGRFTPIIEINSLDEVSDAIALAGAQEGDYAVISVVKRFKAQVKIVIEEV